MQSTSGTSYRAPAAAAPARPKLKLRNVRVESYEQRPYTRGDTVTRVWSANATDRYWRGWAGNWHLDIGHPEAERVVRGVRSFKFRDETRRVLDLILVFDAPRPFTRPRAEDDLHQHNVFFDTGVSDPGVLAHGVAVTDDARSQQLVAVDSSAYANLIMSLPRLAGESASAGAAGGPQKPGLWGFELFLHDDTGSQQRDTHRWSAIVLYGTQFGDLQRVSLVQEHYTDLSPATVNVVRVAAGRIREPRDSLLGDDPSSTLVDPKDPAGRRLSLVRGGDGLLHSVVGETPVVWQGPGGGGAASGSGSSSGGGGGSSALVRLPDSMYLHLPVSLAMVSPSEPFRLEFGGPMREDDGLMRRMVVEYGADGRLSGLHKDTFRTRPVD